MLARALRGIRESRLGRRAAPASSAWRAIIWWESRRPAFNIIVGATGVFTGLSMAALGFGAAALFGVPFDLPDPPIVVVVGVVLYGLMANVCYTLGWVAELAVRRAWPEDVERFASVSFALGVAASVLLTLLPIAFLAALLIVAPLFNRGGGGGA